MQAGVTLVQYREKTGLGRSMLEKAIALRRLCHRYNVPLLVNDRLDIALLSGADGVHLGQDDIPVAEARRLADLFAVNNAAACQPDFETVAERASVHRMEAATTSQTAKSVLQTEKHFIIGATAHNVQEALAAEAAGADYLGCGAVFATNTKRYCAVRFGRSSGYSQGRTYPHRWDSRHNSEELSAGIGCRC